MSANINSCPLEEARAITTPNEKHCPGPSADLPVTDISAGSGRKMYKARGLGKGPEVDSSGLMGRPQACSPYLQAPWRQTES